MKNNQIKPITRKQQIIIFTVGVLWLILLTAIIELMNAYA